MKLNAVVLCSCTAVNVNIIIFTIFLSLVHPCIYSCFTCLPGVSTFGPPPTSAVSVEKNIDFRLNSVVPLFWPCNEK